MQGKTFSVSKATSNVDRFVKSEPQFVKEESPFLTSLFKADEIAGMSGEQIQESGVDCPPFHCGCRDTIVAQLD